MGQYTNSKAKANKHLEVAATPDSVIADATAAKLVGKGNICRIKGPGFVSFGDASVGIPSAVTKETIEIETGYYSVISSGEYIRTSAVMRIEVLKD